MLQNFMGKVKSLFCSVVYYAVYITQKINLPLFKYIYLKKIPVSEDFVFLLKCFDNLGRAEEGVINIFTNIIKIPYQFPSFLPFLNLIYHVNFTVCCCILSSLRCERNCSYSIVAQKFLLVASEYIWLQEMLFGCWLLDCHSYISVF